MPLVTAMAVLFRKEEKRNGPLGLLPDRIRAVLLLFRGERKVQYQILFPEDS